MLIAIVSCTSVVPSGNQIWLAGKCPFLMLHTYSVHPSYWASPMTMETSTKLMRFHSPLVENGVSLLGYGPTSNGL